MAQTYAEFLAANGASPEDIKILDTPVARKAYDAMEKKAADAATESIRLKADMDRYDKWYKEEATPINIRLQSERDAAVADAAAEKARVKKLQEMGLLELAEQQEPGSTKPQPGETPAFDPKAHNLVTADVLNQVAEREGDAIAVFADISAEHYRLFPDKPISFRELRREAVQRKVSIESLWLEKYGVPAKRAEVEATRRKAEVDKAVADAVKAKEVELASKYGDPHVRPALASNTPFMAPPSVRDSESQPWNKTDAARSAERTGKVLEKLSVQ